jgi:DNA-binding NarL/FixJ family response regulator
MRMAAFGCCEAVTIKVLIADDQPLMRIALGMSLRAEPDIEVVGEAVDGFEAIELATVLNPDVIVMDVRMPRLDGVAATRRLTYLGQAAPQKILIITTFDLDEYVVEALRAGASGFLLKDATSEELAHAVRVIAAGDALLAPSVTRRLLDNYAQRLPAAQPNGSGVPKTITKREFAVLMLIARGLSNAAIGQQLHLAESSVKTHVGHLLAKLAQHDRVQLVIYAYETGLVVPTGSHRSTISSPLYGGDIRMLRLEDQSSGST